MNSNYQKPHGGHFLNGFVFGLIIGAALVFLFGTKKGKKLLQILSEEKFDDLKQFLDQMEDEEDEFVEEEIPAEETSNGHANPEPIVHKPVKKRLFRGIRRRN